MGNIKSHFFGGGLDYNLIIGGVGGTLINSAVDLASHFYESDLLSAIDYDVADITSFEIVGTEVRATMSVSYKQKLLFKNNTNITSFLDLDSKFFFITAQEYFLNCVNLAEFYSESLTLIINAHSFVSGCGALNSCNIGGGADANFERYNFFNTGTLGGAFTFKCFHTDEGMFGRSDVSQIFLPDCTVIRGQTLASITQRSFWAMPNVTLIEMKKVVAIGDNPAFVYNCFLGTSNCEIRVNIALATINGGFAHATLIDARDNKSFTVNFYDNSGVYVSTL